VAAQALPVTSGPSPQELEAKQKEADREREAAAAAESKAQAATEAKAAEEGKLKAERAAVELASIRSAKATVEAEKEAAGGGEPGSAEAKASSQWDHVTHVATVASEEPADGTKKGFKKEKVAISYRECMLWFQAAALTAELNDIVVKDDSNKGNNRPVHAV